MFPILVQFRFETVWVDCSNHDCWLNDGRRAPVRTVFGKFGKIVGPVDRTACDQEPEEVKNAWLESFQY